MEIKVWSSFSKRKNSTLIPSGGTTVQAKLKEPTSELNPVFELQGVTSAKYVYCSDFGRYYYVTDVVHVTKDIIQISCAIDVLASHKGAIGAVNAFVEYSSSDYNEYLTDTRNRPNGVGYSAQYKNFSALSTLRDDAISYIIGVCCNNGINYYNVSGVALQNIMSKCFDKNLIASVLSSFFDLKNVIVSCTAIPMNAMVQNAEILIGNDSGASVSLGHGHLIPMNGRLVTIIDEEIEIPIQSESYLSRPPYTFGALKLPFVGFVDLNMNMAENGLKLKGVLDMVTGDIVYTVGYSGHYCTSYSGNCGANVPICGSSYNGVGTATGIASIVGGGIAAAIAIGNPGAAAAEKILAGGIAAGVSGANQLIQSTQLHCQTNGSISSISGIALGLTPMAVVYTAIQNMTNTEGMQASSGLPLFDNRTLSSLSGFIKCDGASVSISGYESERDEINAHLNTGFYYE